MNEPKPDTTPLPEPEPAALPEEPATDPIPMDDDRELRDQVAQLRTFQEEQGIKLAWAVDCLVRMGFKVPK